MELDSARLFISASKRGFYYNINTENHYKKFQNICIMLVLLGYQSKRTSVEICGKVGAGYSIGQEC